MKLGRILNILNILSIILLIGMFITNVWVDGVWVDKLIASNMIFIISTIFIYWLFCYDKDKGEDKEEK